MTLRSIFQRHGHDVTIDDYDEVVRLRVLFLAVGYSAVCNSMRK